MLSIYFFAKKLNDFELVLNKTNKHVLGFRIKIPKMLRTIDQKVPDLNNVATIERTLIYKMICNFYTEFVCLTPTQNYLNFDFGDFIFC